MLKKLGLVLCCGLAVLSVQVLAATPKDVNLVQETQQFAQGKNVAIVVGIENYDQSLSAFTPLDWTADDAQKLSGTLSGRGYQVTRLLNNQASKEYVLNAIRNAGKTVHNGDGTLVFSFSGHGSVIGKENYLAVAGASALNLPGTGLSVSEIVKAIRETGIKRAVLLLDACRNDAAPGVKSVGSTGFLDRDYGEGIQVLYSTKFGEISWEHADLKQSVFSYFVNRGFAGDAIHKDGVVTFSSLASYVETNVTDWTYKKRLAQTQKPFRDAKGEYRGDFVLARLGGGQVVNPPVQQPQQRQPTPSPPPQRQPQVINRPAPVTTASRKSFEPEMVNIPAGSFMMGCVAGRDDVEGGCDDDEKPEHRVNIPAFMISKYEVTFDEWDACTAAGACIRADDQGWGRGRRPVINVSWKDVQQYLRWLSGQTGHQYRLPSESEWEYAARGRGDSAYPWGPGISCGNARYGYLMNGNPCKSTNTVNVGSYAANGFGLHDTAGNVWEWVQDCYSNSYAGALTDGKANQACDAAASRVLRGGSWYNNPRLLRSALRYFLNPDDRGDYVGFRAARTR